MATKLIVTVPEFSPVFTEGLKMKRFQGCVLFSVPVLCGILATPAVEAAETVRTWSDRTGQFQVEALLVDQNKEQVQLRKADGRVITVPISQLSLADQEYLRQREKPAAAVNPFSGGSKPSPDMQPAAAEDSAARIMPDPGPPRSPLPVAAIDLKTPGNSDKVQPLIVVDATAGWVLVTVVHVEAAKVTGSTGYLCDLSTQTVRQTITWQDGIRPLCYDSEADRLVALAGVTHIGYAETLVAFRGISADERYRAPLDVGRTAGPQSIQYATADASTVVVGASSAVHVFDAATGQKRWQAPATVISAGPALSPGGKQLAYQDRFELKIVDVNDGAQLDLRTLPTQSALYLGYSPDGRMLAASNVYGLTVWDVRRDDPLLQMTSSQPGYEPGWLNEENLLLGGRNFVRIPDRLLLWSYRAPPFRWSLGAPNLVGQDSLAYLASDSGKMLRLVSVSLPHPEAAAVLRSTSRDSLIAVPSGSKIAIRLQVERGVDDEVKGYVTAALEHAGWTVVPQAPVELVATVRAEPPKPVQYRSMYGNPRDSGDTVRITPFSFLAEIRQGGQTLWERKSLERPPSMIRLEAGETVQQAADRYSTPNLVFFKSLVLPPEIVKPQFATGLGQSTLGPEGVQ
jgi:hypothetical protein